MNERIPNKESLELDPLGEIAAAGDRPNHCDFLRVLFRALGFAGIRYRVSRSSPTLPHEFSSRRELEVAIHSKDSRNLSTVLISLGEDGYQPIQVFEESLGARRYVFGWFEDLSLQTGTVDFVFDHSGMGSAWQSDAAIATGGRLTLLQPLHAAFRFVGESLRCFRRRLRPNGLCIILLGPDGVGKSTLVAGLGNVFNAAFRQQTTFHWRPGVVLPIRDGDDSLKSPHEEPERSAMVSICYLFGFFLDFCAGYLLRVRPLLAQSGLVFFDRYFPDLLVDRKRYRYSGPIWMVQLLWKLLPKSDHLILVLTASEEAILSRKQQLPPEELRRQLAEYRRMSLVTPKAHLVETDLGIEPALATASRIVFQHLARRFRKQSSQPEGARVQRASMDLS